MNPPFKDDSGSIPSLSTQQLLYLRAAARAPSWTKAAAELGVTQSALSQGIAELERRLALELFRRVGRRRVLTAAGAEVLTQADKVLAQASDLGRVAGQLRSGSLGTFRLGLIDSAAVATCRPALASVRALAGDALHVIVDTSVPLTRAVQRGELDLAVVVADNLALRSGGSGRASESAVTANAIAEESMVVVAPGSGGSVDSALETALSEPARWGPWVMPPAGSTTRLLIEEALRARGADPTTILESSNPTVLLSMVELGLGWTVLPDNTRDLLPADVVVADELFRRKLVAVTRSGAPSDPRTKRFLASVRS